MILYNDVKIGFCQYYRMNEAGEIWHGAIKTAGTDSIDYLIGEGAYLGRGYGRTAVQKLLSIIALEPGAHLVIVQPEKENTTSCNTLLSADFLYDGANRLYRFPISGNPAGIGKGYSFCKNHSFLSATIKVVFAYWEYPKLLRKLEFIGSFCHFSYSR